jgi:hypothetical protein
MTSTCNADLRVPTEGLAMPSYEGAEELGISNLIQYVFNNYNQFDVVVVHVNKQGRLADDPNFPKNFYSSQSGQYNGESYVTDAVLGNAIALAQMRAMSLKENWLIVATSDHGGLVKNVGTNPGNDEVIPFVVSTVAEGVPLRLYPLLQPTTQMDVAPTVMQWFSSPTSAELAGLSTIDGMLDSNGNLIPLGTAAPTAAPTTAAPATQGSSLPTAVPYDGQVQGICSNGYFPRHCVPPGGSIGVIS